LEFSLQCGVGVGPQVVKSRLTVGVNDTVGKITVTACVCVVDRRVKVAAGVNTVNLCPMEPNKIFLKLPVEIFSLFTTVVNLEIGLSSRF
jgi:hypothetical protein